MYFKKNVNFKQDRDIKKTKNKHNGELRRNAPGTKYERSYIFIVAAGNYSHISLDFENRIMGEPE